MTKLATFSYIFLSLAVGFAAGMVVGRSSAPEAQALTRTFGIELEGRPLKGPRDARVSIVEFTDYECSFCRRYTLTTYPALLRQYADRINYTVRHFPASFQHRRAHRAAQAAECAADQGNFFEYHEVLFQNAGALDEANLVRYAAMMGMNVDVFRDCLASGVKADVVDDDIQAGIARGVAGTPSFLINGRVLFGAQPIEVFQRAIERELRGG